MSDERLSERLQAEQLAEFGRGPAPPPALTRWIVERKPSPPTDPAVEDFVRRNRVSEATARAALYGGAWIERARQLKDAALWSDEDLACRSGLSVERVTELFAPTGPPSPLPPPTEAGRLAPKTAGSRRSGGPATKDEVARIAAALRVRPEHLIDPDSARRPAWAIRQ